MTASSALTTHAQGQGALVTVILPTHDHASTLDLSIESILEQTVADLALVVIGDGVGDDTRDVVRGAMARDARVTFMDLPKSARHAELARHAVIQASVSPVIAYHGDDDLLMPHHLEHMVNLLNGVDFAHPLPAFVEPDGSISVVPTDLTRSECLSWHLVQPPRNAVSLTGVVHTRESYFRLPYGWRETPPDIPTDLYMWRQFFTLPGLRAISSRRATTLKFPAPPRRRWTPLERRGELLRWRSRMRGGNSVTEWDAVIQEKTYQLAVNATLLRSQLTEVNARLSKVNEREASRKDDYDAVLRQLGEIESSRTWRAMRGYRYLRGRFAQRLAAHRVGSEKRSVTRPPDKDAASTERLKGVLRDRP